MEKNKQWAPVFPLPSSWEFHKTENDKLKMAKNNRHKQN